MCKGTYPLSFYAPKGNTPGIFHCLTHQSITAGEKQRLFDNWRVIMDDINDEFYVSWLTDIPETM